MENLGFTDYLKLAFNRHVRVPLLGPLPANKMALGIFAVLGLAHPGFWLLGAAAEVAYLFGLAGSPRFQKVVQGERLLAAQQEWDNKMHQAVDRLKPESRQRYQQLLEQCRRILGISEALGDNSLGNFRDLRARNLNQMLGIFLRLLKSREVISENLRGLDPRLVEEEIANLEQLRSKTEDEALARSLEGTIEIQRKRLENHQQALSSLKVIAAELRRIEQQIELMREESAVSGKPQILSDRLEAVTTAMSETTRWMDEHSELLGNVLSDDDSMTVPDLPSLPTALEGE